MKKRNLWLAGGAAMVLLAAMVVGPTVLAEDYGLWLEVQASNPVVDELLVTVEPIYLGGRADLYATPEGGEALLVHSFPLDVAIQPVMVSRIAPPHVAITYQYQAFDVAGFPAGWSKKATAGERLEPGWD